MPSTRWDSLIDENIVRRLGFIRYLYGVAVDQSQLPEPMCASSLLTFHDAVELFLLLACKHKDTAPPQSFIDHWEKLDHRLSDSQITQKQAMKELDKARANLKHFGIIPVRDNIQEYLYTTRRFFEENTPTVFGVDFDSFSMVHLIRHPTIRMDLEEAERLREQDELEEAIGKVAVAFARMLRDYSKQIPLLSGLKWSSLSLTHRANSPSRSRLDDYSKKMFGDILEQIDALRKVEPMQDAMVALALDLDYGRYRRFLELTPPVVMEKSKDENLSPPYPSLPTPQPNYARPHYVNLDSYRFCFDFVIEAVIRAQAN